MEKRQHIVQGEAFSIAFFHVSLPLAGGGKYELEKDDTLEFTIGRENREPVVRLTYPGEIIKEVNSTYIVHLTAEQTAQLPALLYRMRLKVDLKGLGDEEYYIVNQELEVQAK